jgi:mono/diheme cytochrome c family protein
MNGFRILVLSILLIIALAACGGSDNGDSEPRPTNSPLPQFEEVVPPTEPPELATVAAATIQARENEEIRLDPTAVARGQTNWERLECASCHGANGEGGAGEIDGITAPPLVDLALTEAEFIDWMRSGGSLGSAHQYSTDRLSDSGGRNLYQYILSLGQ